MADAVYIVLQRNGFGGLSVKCPCSTLELARAQCDLLWQEYIVCRYPMNGTKEELVYHVVSHYDTGREVVFDIETEADNG